MGWAAESATVREHVSHHLVCQDGAFHVTRVQQHEEVDAHHLVAFQHRRGGGWLAAVPAGGQHVACAQQPQTSVRGSFLVRAREALVGGCACQGGAQVGRDAVAVCQGLFQALFFAFPVRSPCAWFLRAAVAVFAGVLVAHVVLVGGGPVGGRRAAAGVRGDCSRSLLLSSNLLARRLVAALAPSPTLAFLLGGVLGDSQRGV